MRMILLWSSSGNVLRMQGALKKKITDVSVPVHSCEVTQHQLANVFGPSVPYEYVLKGKRVYDAKVMYFQPLLQLVDHMAHVAHRVLLGGGQV